MILERDFAEILDVGRRSQKLMAGTPFWTECGFEVMPEIEGVASSGEPNGCGKYFTCRVMSADTMLKRKPDAEWVRHHITVGSYWNWYSNGMFCGHSDKIDFPLHADWVSGLC